MDVIVPLTPAFKLQTWPGSCTRACYNVYDLDDETKALHLQKLLLSPQRQTKQRGVPECYSCAVHIANNGLAIPRFYGLFELGLAEHDNTVPGTAVSYTFDGVLKPYQRTAIDATIKSIQRFGGAMLSAACGSGKTVMSIAIAAILRVRAVVLVHKGFLLDQWRERIAAFAPDATVGVVGQGINDLDHTPDITLCTIQTILSRFKPGDGTFNYIGLVAVDECHHVCARSFMKALQCFPARYRLGITATPERRDGLGFALPWFFGPVAAMIKRTATNLDVQWLDGALDLRPVLNHRNGDLLYAATVTSLTTCRERNDKIIQVIEKALAARRQIIVISERRTQLQLLRETLGQGTLYVGETSKEKKETRDLRAQTANPLFATFAMAEEGLDVPRLDFLVFASPRASPACIEQCVGRIQRPLEDKPTPTVVDFRDGVFRGMAKGRERLYKKWKNQK